MINGVCPEQWILEHPDVLVDLQKRYIEAGTDILYAPTFTSNRIKLGEYGLDERCESITKELVALSKKACEVADRPVYVAGDMTMTGEQLYPVGSLGFEDLVEVYKEQVRYSVEAGVDLFVVETMMSLQECRAAVLAIKETCDLPIMVTLTFNDDMRTLYGTEPETAVVVMEAMGVDAVGVNCSTGPQKLCEVVERMVPYAGIPLVAKPNAGLPKLVDGKTQYDMGAEEFGIEAAKLTKAGASIVGGCCGTTPEHIKELFERVKGEAPVIHEKKHKRVLTNEQKVLEIDLDGNFLVIGERINPTGKKALQEELKQGKMNLVLSMAEEQMEAGAAILDVNMGMNGIDEKEMMLNCIYALTGHGSAPLCIDSSYPEILEEALRIYPGRALINSISLEPGKAEKMLPVAKKYGAMFILLPLSGAGLPKSLEEKKSIIKTIMDKALEVGLEREDIMVDGLVNTIGANKQATWETIDTIRYCKEELGVATTCGLSNISFGLPQRQFVNATFLSFARLSGLTSAIANPGQALFMNTVLAADLLLDKPDAADHYIEGVVSMAAGSGSVDGKKGEDKKTGGKSEGTVFEVNGIDCTNVYQDVLKGRKERVVDDVKALLAKDMAAATIVDSVLIPAINEVGQLFDKQIYFLPQLIGSAEAMKTGIDHLEPLLLTKVSSEKQVTVVMATVEGDIHDIGKNLVVLMLKNYGYRVIDLGKDVPAETIIDTAIKENAEVVGLSALMTTTMMQMQKVVQVAKEKGCKAQIIIGGAVTNHEFSDEISADGYSKDAKEAVELVQRLLKHEE
jgi:5-methyltetrahydrofolate--homocysteine methyltransferase